MRLTQAVKAGGCASKLAPGSLMPVLARLPRQADENLLVGFESADDAGVYRIATDLATVHTADFFTPMVDDPFTYGAIAAANALSDVYAMGGRPITALSLVCYPEAGDSDVLEQIMRGGLAKMAEAGSVVLGGHSVRDPEMKFGYAVTGLVHPDRVYRNTGAQPGDVLLLTKAIGTGVITTALKQGRSEAQWVAAAVAAMTTLNRAAAEVAQRYRVHAVTDVTGFGLIGHARELALGSGVRLRIDVAAVPLLEGALTCAQLGAVPAGLLANREFAECVVDGSQASAISEELRLLLYDPQTSGGLLLSVADDDARELLGALRDAGVEAARIGEVLGHAESQGTKFWIELRS